MASLLRSALTANLGFLFVLTAKLCFKSTRPSRIGCGLKDFQLRHCHFMLHSTATLCFKAQGSQAASVGPRSVNQSHAISTETIKWPQVSILNHNVAGSMGDRSDAEHPGADTKSL